MGRASTKELAVFCGLVCAGIALRMQFQYLPNFAPVAALALFSGYFFRSRLLAVAAPVSVMMATDWLIGAYHPVLMAAVYGTLALPVLFRGVLRRWLDVSGGSGRQAVLATCGLIGCGLASSIAFFVVTNFATWLVGGLYASTWDGLNRCFIQAIPFFRFTVVGDLAFASGLFGSYALVCILSKVRQPTIALTS